MNKSIAFITFFLGIVVLIILTPSIDIVKDENILDSTYSKEDKIHSDDTYYESSIEPELVFDPNEEEIKIRYMWSNIKWK